MIMIEQLNPKNHPLDEVQIENILWVQKTLNLILATRGESLVINRCFSTPEEQEEIYKVKNEKRVQAGLHPLSVPMGSCHLKAAAADISDPDGSLKKWIIYNLEFSETNEIYYERFEATGGLYTGWVHLQRFPPASGKRFFYP